MASPRRRGRTLVPTLIVLGVLLIGFSIFTGIYTDVLWYRSVGYTEVWKTTLGARSLLFIVFGLLFAAAVAVNIVVAYRVRPAYQAMVPGQQELDRYRMALEPYRRLVVGVVVTLLGLIAGSSAAGEWRTYLQWRNGVSFGQKDAQFGKDISFFTFDLPWYRFVLSFAFATVVVALIAAAITHYLYGGLRLQAFLGERATAAARVHLSVLLGVFVLLKAIAYWVDRYSLAVHEKNINKTSFTGLTYTDVNAMLAGKTILAIIALICAALFFANVVRRGWMLPGIGVGLLLLSALLVGGIYPALVQRFQVSPTANQLERPYIKRNIEATRAAYGISPNKVDIQRYDAKLVADADQLKNDTQVLSNIRLLDPQLLSSTYRNLQQIKAFYDFADPLSIDRYTIDGVRRDVVMAVREVSLGGLPDEQRNWINDHTVYTHGFGFVAAPGNELEGGRPNFVSSDIPPVGKLGDFEPRIYFGQESPTYSIVGAPDGSTPNELDYPDDTATSGQRNNTYQGNGGVPIGTFWHKLLFAMKYQQTNILLSGQVNSDSKILYIRDPKQRVEKVAPWLTLDGDPYPAVVGKRIKWIVDGYTTSNGYPYSTRSTLEEATTTSQTLQSSNQLVTPVEKVNYIRNSVKATVDAYSGKVTLYQWDTKDPVLQTWMNAFPDTVEPRSEISDELKAHLRYPEDLFKVQRTLLATYHVSNPGRFYNGSDFWRIPVDPTRSGIAGPQPPYYVTLKMPGQAEPKFSLTSTYVPTGDRNNLAAFVAVDADPGEDYGKLRVLELPRSLQINGPSQVQNQLESEDTIAEEINILKRGTTVKYGNLLTFPIGGGLLYVEPVYVQAEATTSFPLLRKVLVSFGNNVAFEDTLQEALDTLFAAQGGAPGGGEPPPTTTPPPGGGGPSGQQNPALTQALQDAQDALEASQRALAAGDFAAYGKAQQDLRDAIARAVAAEQAGGQSPSPSGTASPGATASPSPSG